MWDAVDYVEDVDSVCPDLDQQSCLGFVAAEITVELVEVCEEGGDTDHYTLDLVALEELLEEAATT